MIPFRLSYSQNILVFWQSICSNVFTWIWQGRAGELKEVLNASVGIMHFVKKFWQGFYPLLLLEISNDSNGSEDEDEDATDRSQVPLLFLQEYFVCWGGNFCKLLKLEAIILGFVRESAAASSNCSSCIHVKHTYLIFSCHNLHTISISTYAYGNAHVCIVMQIFLQLCHLFSMVCISY